MSGGVLLSGSIASRRRERGAAAAVAGGVLLFLAFHVFDCGDLRPPHASAQDVAAQVEQDDATVLILAQAMVAEAGWDATEDHAAIAHVLRRGADRLGIPFLGYTVRYVSLLRVNADGRHIVQSERASWVRGLALDARRPEGWPTHLAWPAHVDRWLATIERARAFLRGELPDPCASRPAHWGMRSGVDLERAQRAGWVLARCSKSTRNAFWRIR